MRKIYGKSEDEKEQLVFAADADIIINLAKIANGKMDELTAAFDEKIVAKYKALYKAVFYGKIKLFITPSVLAELGFSSTSKNQYSENMLHRQDAELNMICAKFVRSFCEVFSEKQTEAFNIVVKTLADDYCLRAGFNYMYENGIIKPCKDAFNLAQATVFGLPFLTGNSKDFAWYSELPNGQRVDKKRLMISLVNKYYGYVYDEESSIYENLGAITIYKLIPKHLNDQVSKSFIENIYSKWGVQNLDKSEVEEDDRAFYETFDKDLETMESGGFVNKSHQTAIVMLKKDENGNYTPSFIYFANTRNKRDLPFSFKNINDIDIMYFREEDMDEDGIIRTPIKTVTVPRSDDGHMDLSSPEYNEYVRLMGYKGSPEEPNLIIDVDDKTV